MRLATTLATQFRHLIIASLLANRIESTVWLDIPSKGYSYLST